MADNFNVKQFLAENKLGPYSRLKETEEGYMGTQYDSSEDMAVDMVKKGITEYEVIYIVRDGRCYRKDDEGNMDEVNMSYCKRFAEGEEKVEEAGQGDLMTVDRIEEIVNNLARNISTNSNIPTQEKLGLVQALKELKDLVEDLGASVEMGMNETKKPIKEGGDIFDDIEADLEYGDDGIEGAIEYLREVIDFCEKKIVELENEQGYEDEENDLGETKKSIDEKLSPEYIDRMEGLANIQDLAILKEKLSSLASDWMKEGFEKEDVLEYMETIIGGSVNEAIDAKSFGGILKSDNPEGDALVLRFLQGIAKKFEYPVSHAAMFVKERIKKLGY